MGRPIENDAFEMVNVLDLLKWAFLSKKIKIWDDTCKISTNMSTPPLKFWTRPATAALPGWCKADSSQGCCGSSPRGRVLLGENCGVIRVHPTGWVFFSRIQLIQFMTFLNQNRPQTNQVGYVSSMDLFLVVHKDRWPHSIGQLDGKDERDDGRSAWWTIAGARQRGQTIQSQGDMCCVRA